MTLLPPIRSDHALRLLVIHYGEAHRHYHNAEHLLKVMRAWREYAEIGAWQHPIEAGLALAYHDAVYDPKSKVNEETSAGLALTDCGAYGCDLARVTDMILATKRHGDDFDADPDTLLIMDIDVMDLGASAQQFDRNFVGVRMEFAHVAGPDFVQGQRAFFEKMLSRRSIYRTTHFQDREEQAQRNMRRSLTDEALATVASRPAQGEAAP